MAYVLQAIVQIICGICYWQGSSKAKYWLMGFSAVLLLVFPIGTAVGAYSLWFFSWWERKSQQDDGPAQL
jgi:hypothetical protein